MLKRVPMKTFNSTIRRIKILILESLIRYFPGLVRALVSRAATDDSPAETARHALSFSRDPILTLNFFSSQSGYSWYTLWVAINKIASENDPAWSVLHDSRSVVSSRELRFCIELKGLIVSKPSGFVDFQRLFDEYSLISESSVQKVTPIVGLLSTLVVTKAPVNKVRSMLECLKTSIYSLTEFQQIKFLTRLADQGQCDEFEWWETHRKKPMSDAGFLKVSLLRSSLFSSEGDSFSRLEQAFMSLPYRLSETYRDEIKPLYDGVPESQNLLSARFHLELKSNLKKMIADAISEGRSLSYLRLGDGECYGFADQKLVDEKGEIRQEEHWWGEQLDSHLRHKLQSGFFASLSTANILGVPTVLRLIKDFNLEYRKDYSTNSLMARILCVMKGAAAHIHDKTIVEDQSNLFLFDSEFIDRIFLEAEKVCVISGLRSDLVHQWAPNVDKLECVEIPTHRLLRAGTLGSKTDGILPHVYENYMDSIRALSGSKVVFLVSAGFIGKIFVAEAARNGSVALDVGQMLVSAVEKKRAVG